jgi:hypothetical protein
MLDWCNGWLCGGVAGSRPQSKRLQIESAADTARRTEGTHLRLGPSSRGHGHGHPPPLSRAGEESPDSRSQSNRTIAGYRRPERKKRLHRTRREDGVSFRDHFG